MTFETIFLISNALVFPFWALMIVLPHWKGTRQVMQTFWPLLPPALMYALLLIPNAGQVFSALASPGLGAISAGLATPSGALIAWAHILAFDLFAGRWVYLDSRKRGLSAWLASPALFLIFMAGPLGWLVYRLLTLVKKSQ